jgi:hypothetical protein
MVLIFVDLTAVKLWLLAVVSVATTPVDIDQFCEDSFVLEGLVERGTKHRLCDEANKPNIQTSETTPAFPFEHDHDLVAILL